ncbi:MAG: hypothetical protein PHH47_10375 [Gallionella sp.]|nr:hypothetical protein [Gallionella sp.]MDD5612298.1 hypothetical protein [Gallionella sp.]
MARYADSNELKIFKKEATQKFIDLIEKSCKLRTTEFEEKLGIGDGTGTVWCKYRRGSKSMALPNLHSKIKKSIKDGLLPANVGQKLLSEVINQEIKLEMAGWAISESYVYDPRASQLKEFTLAVEHLILQVNNLLEEHQPKNIVAALAPLHKLILDLSSRKEVTVKPAERGESVEELLLRDIRKKWGEEVSEDDVWKIFGAKHGLEIVDGFATSQSVAIKMAEARKEALDAMNFSSIAG